MAVARSRARRRGRDAGCRDVERRLFEQHVRPLLAKHCYECHSAQAKQLQGNLLLDTKAGWQHGGDSGPAIVPGKPDDSLLVKAIRYDDDVQMPPSGKLAANDIAVLRHWVQIEALIREAVRPRRPRSGRSTWSRNASTGLINR